MVVIALAGASTGLGRTVLNVFLTSPHEHKIILLSRSPDPSLTARGVDVKVVDYTSTVSLASALVGVHTVLSFIGGMDTSVLESSQLALLIAAKEAGVKRFAPSEYAASTNEGIDAYAVKERVWQAGKSSGLEYTKFSCGLFLNILGTGTPKVPTEGSWARTGEEEALGGLRPWDFVINKRQGTADVPGDGDAKMTLTSTEDVGRFVLRALDLEEWPEELGICGDVKSFNELVYLLEKAQGRKFLVKHNSVREMEDQIRKDESTRFYNQVRIRIAQGGFEVPGTLNRLVPDIKPTTAENTVG
ncbi:NmrA-like protein 1 [Elsinoe fawcettii]|nr:NmrA-like protein 1 [Elsinoe fawcettii]